MYIQMVEYNDLNQTSLCAVQVSLSLNLICHWFLRNVLELYDATQIFD
jgi:hypothetical protein